MRRLIAAACGLFVAYGFTLFAYGQAPAFSAPPLVSPAQVSPAQPPKPVPCCPAADTQKHELLWKKLLAEIMSVDNDLNGVMSIAILDLADGRTFLHHADEVMPQASSIKIAVLAELYRQVQAGKLKLDDKYIVRQEDLVSGSDIMLGLTPGVTQITDRDLATMMIGVSDNSATNVLIDRVGLENVNAMLSSLGLKTTRLRRKMMDLKAAAEGRENVSSAREMMVLLETIYRGKLLNKDLTADFLKMLGTHKDSSFTRALPDDASFADKPGELEAVRNDSGIIFIKNRPFILCVMTAFLKDESQGQAAIGKVAALAYQYFDIVGRASQYGRVVSPK